MFRSPVVQSAKKKSKRRRAKFFLNFFSFLASAIFVFFVSLRLSLHKKKEKIFLTPEKNTHIKDHHHHGTFCDDDERKDDDAIVVLCILFVFVAFISLSLSLLSRVIEDFLTNRGRESTDFFFDSFFPVNF